MKELTINLLKLEVRKYIKAKTKESIKKLYGVSDGKAVGTYIELDLCTYLNKKYSFIKGNAAQGIDFPSLNTDMKVTSIRQPQSSCPFKDATQKVYGLGYNVLVMVYQKVDDHRTKSAKMHFLHSILIDAEYTADFQTTKGINDVLKRDGNEDDIIAFLQERNMPLDEIGIAKLTKRIFSERPKIGYLTISNALQWRLQYSRVIGLAKKGEIDGIEDII